MKPIEFKGCNVVYGKDQDGVEPLPVCKFDNGEVVSCWQLSWKEMFKLLFRRKIWVSVQTYNKPLQPICVSEESLVTYTK